MYELDKQSGKIKIANGKPKAKTSHTLNPVPCLIYDPESQDEYHLSEAADAGALGISSLAATCLNLLGFRAPEDYDPAVIHF